MAALGSPVDAPLASSSKMSYRMILPPGWFRFDLRVASRSKADLEDQIVRLVQKACARLGGPVAAEFGDAIAGACRSRFEEAKAAGSIDAYMLVEPPGGIPLDAALIVSLVPSPVRVADLLTPADFGFTSEATQEKVSRTATMLRIGGLDALRESTSVLDSESRVFKRSDQISYTYVIPDSPRSLQASFSSRSLTSDAPMVKVFDAMASTVRVFAS